MNKSKNSNTSELLPPPTKTLGSKPNIKSAQNLRRSRQSANKRRQNEKNIVDSELVPANKFEMLAYNEKNSSFNNGLNTSNNQIKKGSKLWSNLRYQRVESDEELGNARDLAQLANLVYNIIS